MRGWFCGSCRGTTQTPLGARLGWLHSGPTLQTAGGSKGTLNLNFPSPTLRAVLLNQLPRPSPEVAAAQWLWGGEQ